MRSIERSQRYFFFAEAFFTLLFALAFLVLGLLVSILAVVALGLVFFAAAFFELAFFVATLVAVALGFAADFAFLPPKATSQPSAYLVVEPNRVIVMFPSPTMSVNLN